LFPQKAIWLAAILVVCHTLPHPHKERKQKKTKKERKIFEKSWMLIRG
jgi:hypothetical protein